MPAVRVRLAYGQQSPSRMDATGQGEFDFAAGQLSLARRSRPCCGCRRRATERQSDQLAERLLSKSRRPLVFQIDDEWIAYGPPQFQTEMAERLSSGKDPWSGEEG